jgi:hypothetical protein
MMKKKFIKALLTVAVVAISFLPATGAAADATSANGKYSELIQEFACPTDSAKYGSFRDYGYWGGGAWCGQQGKAGYWVWVSPKWYVWASKAAADASSANGKYSELLQTINCPKDAAQYGSFTDYGYWGGGDWCGQQGKSGYWVWVAPNWYVWGKAK